MSDDNAFERAKWLEEIRRADAHRAHDIETEFGNKNFEAAVTAANAAIRIALLINGGAAAAVLAFIGGLAAQKVVAVSELGQVASGLMWFTWGVAFAAISALFAYFTNYFIGSSSARKARNWDHQYVKDTPLSIRWNKVAIGFQSAAILFGVLSLASFVVGATAVYYAILGLQGPATPNSIVELLGAI